MYDTLDYTIIDNGRYSDPLFDNRCKQFIRMQPISITKPSKVYHKPSFNQLLKDLHVSK